MTGLNWRTVALQVQLGLARAGAAAWIAGGVLALGLAAWGWLLSQPGQTTEALQARLLQAQRRLQAEGPQGRSPAPVPAARGEGASTAAPLQAFHAALGEASTTEAYVRQLFAAAGRHEISLGQGEYRWQVDGLAQTERYQIRLPIKGTYAALRGFCDQVLRDLPFAALDELSLKRDALDDETLSAIVQFSLYLHPGAASAAVALPGAGAASTAQRPRP